MNIKETEEAMRLIGQTIENLLPGIGFALFISEFENPGIGNYISNARRDDMIQALRETANRFENDEIIPAVQGEA